jgi:tetratricopeptide (TPR) repeat protein
MLRSAAIGVVILATSTAGLAEPQDDANDHVRRGVELYDRGELDAAIAEFELANGITKTAKGCYALGQALRKKSGDCKNAIEHYRCAVALATDEEVKFKANYQIGRCVIEGGLPQEATPPPASVVTRTEVPPPAPSPWYRDTAGGVLLGLGVGVACVGGGVHLHAELRARDADDNLESFRDADSVGSERLAGTVLVSVGGALIVSSIVRYVIAAR